MHFGNSGESGALMRRRHRQASCDSAEEGITIGDLAVTSESRLRDDHWRRILLLIVAITVHNIPEGLAVGVGFGAVGKTKSATFENARFGTTGVVPRKRLATYFYAQESGSRHWHPELPRGSCSQYASESGGILHNEEHLVHTCKRFSRKHGQTSL